MVSGTIGSGRWEGPARRQESLFPTPFMPPDAPTSSYLHDALSELSAKSTTPPQGPSVESCLPIRHIPVMTPSDMVTMGAPCWLLSPVVMHKKEDGRVLSSSRLRSSSLFLFFFFLV